MNATMTIGPANTVFAKIAGQRKARIWHVTRIDNGMVMVQAEGAIGVFVPETGKGKVNIKGGYFPHLAFAKTFQFPTEFVTEVMAVCPDRATVTTF